MRSISTVALGFTVAAAHGRDVGFGSTPTPCTVTLLDKMRNTPPPPPIL
jgi:hypothetical protein